MEEQQDVNIPDLIQLVRLAAVKKMVAELMGAHKVSVFSKDGVPLWCDNCFDETNFSSWEDYVQHLYDMANKAYEESTRRGGAE